MASVTQPIFGPYDGPRTGAWARRLVIPRYAIREILRSKMTLVLLVAGCVVPVLAMAMIYARHNAAVLTMFGSDFVSELEIGTDFLLGLLHPQAAIAFYLALWIGPPLIARDTQNNALPLYLSRPISRAGYVGGKLAVLLAPLSLVTWVLGGLVIGFQTAFEGMPWLRAHAREAGAFFVSSWVLIVSLSLVVLALSALLRRNWVARGAIFGGMIVLRGVGLVINELFETGWGDLIAPTAVHQTIWADLFGHAAWIELFNDSAAIPVWSAWLMVGLVCTLCLVILARRTRAYEVVA